MVSKTKDNGVKVVGRGKKKKGSKGKKETRARRINETTPKKNRGEKKGCG